MLWHEIYSEEFVVSQNPSIRCSNMQWLLMFLMVWTYIFIRITLIKYHWSLTYKTFLWYIAIPSSTSNCNNLDNECINSVLVFNMFFYFILNETHIEQLPIFFLQDLSFMTFLFRLPDVQYVLLFIDVYGMHSW